MTKMDETGGYNKKHRIIIYEEVIIRDNRIWRKMTLVKGQDIKGGSKENLRRVAEVGFDCPCGNFMRDLSFRVHLRE